MNIIPFDFQNHTVRTILIDGDPWFVARDVAEVLEYSNPRDAISKHCKGVAKRDILSGRGKQQTSIIPERDVYRLIIRSRLPSAERFEEWVVGEVLPTIRRTGRYQPGAPSSLPDFSNPAEAARAWATEYEQKQAALQKVEEADHEIQRLQGVCHDMAVQFKEGLTPPAFCRLLNGVNTQKVQSYLVGRGMLIRGERGVYKAASYYRDKWFAEKVAERHEEGLPGRFVVLTKKGAINLYKLYLKGDLPMKKTWDGNYSHMLFDGPQGGESA